MLKSQAKDYKFETSLAKSTTPPLVWVLKGRNGPHFCRSKAEALRCSQEETDEVFAVEMGTWNAKLLKATALSRVDLRSTLLKVYSKDRTLVSIEGFRPPTPKTVWVIFGCARTSLTPYGFYESFDDALLAIEQRSTELKEDWKSTLSSDTDWSRGAYGLSVDHISIREVRIL